MLTFVLDLDHNFPFFFFFGVLVLVFWSGCLSSVLVSSCNMVFFLSDSFDGGSFAKLFVGSVPKTAREEDVSKLMPVLCCN